MYSWKTGLYLIIILPSTNCEGECTDQMSEACRILFNIYDAVFFFAKIFNDFLLLTIFTKKVPLKMLDRGSFILYARKFFEKLTFLTP